MSTFTLYGQVQEGSVVDGPRALPTSWRTDEVEILAFDRLDDPTPYGWWPWRETLTPELDAATQRLETEVRFDEEAGEIVQSYTLVTLTADEIKAARPLAPDNPTLGDWRVGLFLWKTSNGNRRDDLIAKVKELVASGHPLGGVADERVNYSNNVQRATLLKLAPAVGFTPEDVEESLWRAEQVRLDDLAAG
jgi:hypothetical protein